MSEPYGIRIDSKGRLTIPRQVREEMGLHSGTTVFIVREGEVLRFAKAENPFEELASMAVEDFRQGRTRGLRDFAQEHGIDLDAE